MQPFSSLDALISQVCNETKAILKNIIIIFKKSILLFEHGRAEFLINGFVLILKMFL